MSYKELRRAEKEADQLRRQLEAAEALELTSSQVEALKTDLELAEEEVLYQEQALKFESGMKLDTAWDDISDFDGDPGLW